MSTQTPTKERGWVAYAHEVHAILDDRQSQFRRPVKPQPVMHDFQEGGIKPAFVSPQTVKGYRAIGVEPMNKDGLAYHRNPPFGMPGDRLWLKEKWAMDQVHHLRYPRHGNDLFTRWYAADDSRAGPTNCNDHRGEWRSSVTMPRWASRINLEVTSERVERVQDISADDAELEGIDMIDYEDRGEVLQRYHCGEFGGDHPVDVFRDLWDSINGKRGFGWDKNPWIWAVSFKRVTA